MRFILYLLRTGIGSAFVFLVLSACSNDSSTSKPDDGDGGLPPAPSPATLTQPTSKRELPGALLVRWRRCALSEASISWSHCGVVSPIDAGTGLEIEGRSSFDFGVSPRTITSPDGRLLVVEPWESSEVTIYDLRSWQVLRAIEAVPGLVFEGWSDDGSHVFAWRDYCSHQTGYGRCLAERDRDIWDIDVDQGTARRLATFDFAVESMYLIPPSEGAPGRAYALGMHTDICCGIDVQGYPFIAIIDFSAGVVIAEIPLSDLLIGQPGHWLGDTSEYALYSPAITATPDGSKLYVADSVEQRALVVDLRSMQLDGSVDISEKRSTFGRFGSWLLSQFVSTAEAKGGPSYHRMAKLTLDGRYLMISGKVAEEAKGPAGERSWKERPAGLVIVDTRTMSVVFREKSITSFEVSPDGRWLLAWGFYREESMHHENSSLVADGLKIVDLNSLEVARHLWPGGAEVSVAALSPDSRYAYVRSDGPGIDPSSRICPARCHRLNVLDLESGEVVAERVLDDGSGIISLAQSAQE